MAYRSRGAAHKQSCILIDCLISGTSDCIQGFTNVTVIFLCMMVPRLLFLFSLQLALPLAAQKLPKQEALPLQQAIDQALANNLGLVAARYRPANFEDSVAIEDAAFDVNLFGSSSLNERRSAASSSSLDSASVPKNETRRARAGADKRLSTGATVTVDSGINRGTSNNNSARNPDYSTDVGISLRQPLLEGAWSEVNLAPLARAQARADQSLFLLRSDALDVIADVEIAYWNLAFAQAARELIASNLSLADSLLDENKERQRLGLVTKLEVLQAETELLNQQEDIIQAERLIEDSEDRLRRLVGDVSLMSDLDGDIAVSPLSSQLPPLRPIGEVVRDTILSDADAQAQEKAIEVARINQILAKDDTKPQLDFVGGVDYLGRDDDGPEAYKGAYRGDGYNWNAGLELRFPWGFREARARTRQAQRNLDEEVVRLYDIKQEKAFAARNAWREVQAGMKRIDVTAQALSANNESFEQERARYGSGLIAYRQVLEAQRDLDQAKRNHLVAIIDSLRALVRMSRVDGTILARNGYSWQQLDRLAQPPILEEHALADEIKNY